MERLKTHLSYPSTSFDDAFYYARNGWEMINDAKEIKCTLCHNILQTQESSAFNYLSFYPLGGHLSNCPWLLYPSPPDIRYQFSSFLPRAPLNIAHIHSKFIGHWILDKNDNISCVHNCSSYPKGGIVGDFDTLNSHHYYCPLMQAKKFIED